MTIYIPRTRKRPAEIRIGSLCSGYEGIGMAVQALIGGTVAWVADNEPSSARTLEERLPGVPNLGDITLTDFSAIEQVNILTAGFPCQDVSSAGMQAGLAEGTRTGVWIHVARCIAQQRPDLVLLENVRGLCSAKAHSDLEYCPGCMGDRPDRIMRALGAVLSDLAALGYDAIWQNIRASDTGAPHRRERIFILGFPSIADPASDD
jgi:DNA (cytosine-5)-methyltransferase 1